MTGLPSDSPFDFSAHVLYDKYQRFPTEKSYSNYKKLCITFGKEAISYDDYKYWFKKYSKKTGRDLSDIRGCILSDINNGKSAEKSMDDLCKAFKFQYIDKEDHGYWYKRFENGNLFSRVTFSDFPEDVIAEIVDRCDIESYLNLRNVSFGLRTVIDQLTPPCNDIKLHCEEHRITVDLNGGHIAKYFDKTKSQRSLRLNASKTSSFEHCEVQIQKEFDTETIKRVLNLQPTASPDIYSIPNSNLFFHVLIDCFGLESYKITKN